MTTPEQVRLSAEEGEAIIARLSVYAPSRSDCEIGIQVIRLYCWFTAGVEEAKLSIKKLRVFLFGRGAKRPKPSEPAPSSVCDSAVGEGEATGDASGRDEVAVTSEAAGSTSGSGESESTGKPKGGHRPGTGRLGADAYGGAERVECRHEELAVGQRCPVCGPGPLYELPPGRQIRLDGHALLSALRYELQKLRCSACGQIFTAPLPEEAGDEKSSPRARAVLAVSRCYLGVPLYRLQGYQAMLGVPVPDATQWDQIEKVGDWSYPVFAYLERLGAQGDLIHQDDTSVRILSRMAEHLRIRAQAEALGLSRPTERTGMFTTGLVVQVGAHTICLYNSGRDHAGENLQSLLLQRQAGLAKPLVMSDALSRNEAHEHELIRCPCLAHGRRQFSALEELFPVECQVVIDALKQVFDHDDEAREQQLDPEARWAYHQAFSGPIMDGLKKWLQKQFDDRLVEPNSSLGKALTYMQTHWVTLTRFLSIPNAPLDNNLVERALKLFIRQRKNSLFFRTEHSADIASVITSVIATCLYAGVNALLALYGGDPGVMGLGFLALTSWSLGYANQALARLYEAKALAQEVAHPLTRANNLFHTAWFHLLRRQATAAREAAEASVALSQDQGFALVLVLATHCRGAALALQGQLDEGLTQMHQGLEAFRATGAEMHLTWHLSNLAWAYGQAGQVEAGWSVLVEALTLADERQEHFVRAWLYCIQGTLLLQRHPLDAPQAEACFQQAITVARRQQAKSWELRAAMSLARLWQQQGKHHEARELLAPIYGWFTEGFDTADLQEAKALLGV